MVWYTEKKTLKNTKMITKRD